MYITKVRIKGMHKVEDQTYEIGNPLSTYEQTLPVYLYGENGSGKSTILQAIQLAILGYIPGTNKTNSAIMSHANCSSMMVEVTLTDDDSCFPIRRTFSKVGNTVTATSQEGDEANCKYTIDEIAGKAQLPVFDWNDFTTLSSNKMKDWFIQFLPDDSSQLNWSEILSDSVDDPDVLSKDYVKELLDDISNLDHTSSIDWVRNVNSYLKEHNKYNKIVLDRCEKSINTLIRYDDIEAKTDEELYNFIEELKQKDAQIKKEIDSLTHDIDTMESVNKNNNILIGRIKSEQYRLVPDEDIENYTSSLNHDREELENQKVLIAQLKEKKDNLEQEFESHHFDDSIIDIKTKMSKNRDVLTSNGTCPYTKSYCETISDLKTQVNAERFELSKKLEEVQKAKQDICYKISSCALDIDETNLHITDLQAEIKDLSSRLFSQDEAKSNIERLKSKISESYSEDVIKEKKNKVTQLNEDRYPIAQSITRAEANLKYNHTIDSVISEKEDYEERVTNYNTWIKLTGENGLQTKLSKQQFKNMESGITDSLRQVFSDDVKCKFIISEKANSFSFGLIRNDTYIPYRLLSTGEKTMYTFALMLYVILNSESDLHVLMMDDFLDHLDDSKLPKLFDIISSVSPSVQIIMAGVRKCDNPNIQVINIPS